jgi:hypothetical protein
MLSHEVKFFLFQNSTWTQQCWDSGTAQLFATSICQNLCRNCSKPNNLSIFVLVNPDIVEKLADKKNVEACKERFLIYPYFAVNFLCIFSVFRLLLLLLFLPVFRIRNRRIPKFLTSL